MRYITPVALEVKIDKGIAAFEAAKQGGLTDREMVKNIYMAMLGSVRAKAIKYNWEELIDKNNQDGHWIWIGKVRKASGQPYITTDQFNGTPRRFLYQQHIGGLKKDEHVYQNCGHDLCMNPHHMIVKKISQTMSEKAHGGLLKLRTHCKNGHEFTPENTRLKGRTRICRECSRKFARTTYNNRKQQPF